MSKIHKLKLTIEELQASQTLGHWYTEELKSKGWYTCAVTEKKLRGLEVEYLISKQERLVQEIKENDNDLYATETIEQEESEEIEQDEPQEDELFVDAPEPPAPEPPVANEKPKAKPRKKKIKSLEEVKAKYPHVVGIEILKVSDEEMRSSDISNMVYTRFPAMTTKLAGFICTEIENGKREFTLYEIQCTTCKKSRVIKPQDAFQVTRCEACK